MAKVKNLDWRNGNAQFRWAIPKDLQEHPEFAGHKQHVRMSLGTRDRAEAERKAMQRTLEFEALCDRLREAKKGFPPVQVRASMLAESYGQIDGVAKLLRKPKDVALDTALTSIEDFAERLGSGLPVGAVLYVSDADGTLDELRVPDNLVSRVRDYIAGLVAEDRRDLLSEDAGKAAAISGNPTLMEVIGRAESHKQITKSTAGMYRSSVRLFEKEVGAIRVAQIGAEHVRKFKDRLLLTVASKGMRSATAQRHWRGMSAVLGYSIQDGIVTGNPFSALRLGKFTVDDHVERLPFTKDDLEKLFGGVEKGSQHWLIMRAALMLGARQDEIAQLTAADIVTRDGVICVSINDDDGKRIKNKGSIRLVPIPQRLLDDGFLSIVPTEGRIFSDFPETEKVACGAKVRAWFTDYRDGRGITFPEGTEKVFHSFRHMFTTYLREIAPDEGYAYLTGNAGKRAGANRGYGDQPLVKYKGYLDTIAWPV
ncbi:MAG TPA: DUF6538 domain-containing protein [Aliidongia sp.]|nr:DUF6538 domain-containing protein [Aliidongia sp.]